MTHASSRWCAAGAALALCVIGLTGSRVEPAHAGVRAQGTAAEMRGLWVLRTSLTSPAAIDELVARADAAGFNALFVQVRGRADAYYTSTLEPRGAALAAQPAGFDPLARVIARAHASGLAVHAWFNVNLVSDSVALPAAPDHLIRRHPEWLMVPRAMAASAGPPSSGAFLDRLARWTRANRAGVEGLYASPIPLGARQHAVAVARDLVRRYPVDGLHLDYVRYPNDDFDYSAIALSEFRASLSSDLDPADLAALDARARTEPLVFTARFPERWTAFRRARVTWLVDGLAAAARETRPGIVISAAVLPDPAAALARKLQDWPAWTARGLLDAVCPMAYAERDAEFTAQLDAALAAAGPAAVWTGIGAYRLSATETAARIRESRRAGAGGTLLFSYDSVTAGRGGPRYLRDVGRAAFANTRPEAASDAGRR